MSGTVFVIREIRTAKALRYRTRRGRAMRKSSEFDRDGDPSVKKVVTRTGPLGLVPILYILVSILVLVGMVLWWSS